MTKHGEKVREAIQELASQIAPPKLGRAASHGGGGGKGLSA